MTRYCIAIEKAGIPTVVMAYPGFVSLIKKIGELEDIPDIRFAVRKGSSRRFLWESFSSELLAEELAEALTVPARNSPPRPNAVADMKDSMLTYQGNTVGEVVEAVDKEFHKRHWTDGLPIVPPTEERIQWMLQGTDLPPDHVAGIIEPRKGLATVRTVAINAVMAGARPEYLPVILAMVEAVADPRFFYAGIQATLNSGAEMTIVSGPVAGALGIHSGAGLLGPGWRPNFSIGRTLRLIGINVGGAWPGINKMSPYFAGNRTGSWVFAEAVDLLPAGWKPLHVELGYTREQSTVSLMFLDMITSRYDANYPCSIESISDDILQNGGLSCYRLSCETLLILCPPSAAKFAREGLGKDDIRREIYAKIQVPLAAKGGHQKHMKALPEWIRQKKVGELVPVHLEKPEDLIIAVAGGTASDPFHGIFFSGWGFGSRMVTKEIDKYLPAKWEDLLKEAQQ